MLLLFNTGRQDILLVLEATTAAVVSGGAGYLPWLSHYHRKFGMEPVGQKFQGFYRLVVK